MPPTAPTNITPEVIPQTDAATVNAKTAATQFTQGTKAAATAAIDLAKNIAGVNKETANATSSMFNFSETIEYAKNKLQEMGVEGALGFGSKMATFISGVNNGVATLGNFAEKASSSNLNLSSFINTVNGELKDGISKKILAIVSNMQSMSNAAQGFENSIFTAAMAGGNFSNVFGDMGQSGAKFGSDFDAIMTTIGEKARDSANILGISYSESLSRTQALLSNLPNEYGKVYSIIDNRTKISGERSVDSMELLSQVARGTGHDYSKAIEMAKEMSKKFGSSAKDAGTRMAILADGAKNLKIPFENINGLITELDGTFAMWGDQMQGTMKVLDQVSSALKNSGLGYAGQIKLVQSLGTAINGLSLSQKAFIGISSGMTSGGGMVGVGLKIEQMLQQGKMGEIVKMLQTTMEQKSGSRAISLDEATNNPEMQKTFLIQRGLLEQFGVHGTGEQNRLLEAMSKTTLGGETGQADAERVLTGALNAGNDLTQRQTNLTATIAQNSAEFFGHFKAMQAGNALRVLAGSDGDYQKLAEKSNISNLKTPRQKAVELERRFKEQGLDQYGGEAAFNTFDAMYNAAGAVGTKISEAVGFGAKERYKELQSTPEKERTKEQKEEMLRIERGEQSTAFENPFRLPSSFVRQQNPIAVPQQTQSVSMQTEPLDVNIYLRDESGNLVQQITNKLSVAVGAVKNMVAGSLGNTN